MSKDQHSTNTTLPLRQRWRGFTFYFDKREGNFALYRQKADASFLVFRVLQHPARTVNGTDYPASERLDIEGSYVPSFPVYSDDADAMAALSALATGGAVGAASLSSPPSAAKPKPTKEQLWAGVWEGLQRTAHRSRRR